MELVTNGLVVGLVFPVVPPGMSAPSTGVPEITFDHLSRIFGEVAPAYGYRNFQSDPGGNGGRISGPDPRNGVAIQPGLVQFFDAVDLGPAKATENAVGVLRIVAKHLGLAHVLQVGVKWTFKTTPPGSDGRAFVLSRLLSRTEGEIAELSLGGSIWAGARFVTRSPDEQSQFGVRIEPLELDQTQLYLENDAAFMERTPGVLASSASGLADAVREALEHVQGPVMNYLEKLR